MAVAIVCIMWALFFALIGVTCVFIYYRFIDPCYS